MINRPIHMIDIDAVMYDDAFGDADMIRLYVDESFHDNVCWYVIRCSVFDNNELEITDHDLAHSIDVDTLREANTILLKIIGQLIKGEIPEEFE